MYKQKVTKRDTILYLKVAWFARQNDVIENMPFDWSLKICSSFSDHRPKPRITERAETVLI